MKGILCFCLVYSICFNASASAFGINLPFFNKQNLKETFNGNDKLKLNNEDPNITEQFNGLEPKTLTSTAFEKNSNLPIELEPLPENVDSPTKDDAEKTDQTNETRGMRTGMYGGGNRNAFRNRFRRNPFFGGPGGYGVGPQFPGGFGNGFGAPGAYPGSYGAGNGFGGNRYGSWGNGGQYPGQYGRVGGGFGGAGRFGNGNFGGYPGAGYPGGRYQQQYPQSYFRDYNTESNTGSEPIAAS